MHLKALKLGVLAPLLWLACAATAAQTPTGEPASPNSPVGNEPDRQLNELEELDEVLVSGARRIRDPVAIKVWLKRLVGQFAYDGYVELRDEEASVRMPVRGASKCVAYDAAPAVQCVIQVVWPEAHGRNVEDLPGAVSTLAPAMILYGIDLNYLGIRYLQVDNRGMANGGLGYLSGNTLITTTQCVDLPGDCRRTSRISAQPGGKAIQMEIDVVRGKQRMVRYSFLLRRMTQVQRGQSAEGTRK